MTSTRCAGYGPSAAVHHVQLQDASRYKNGVHVKELSNLNRDLRKVIVRLEQGSYSVQPDNALILKKWEGDNADRNLHWPGPAPHEIKDSGIDDAQGRAHLL